MEDRLTSIIIATKNEEQNIERLLQSINRQTYQNYEVIIVDNFSTDRTVNIAQQYTKDVYRLGPERSTQRNFGAQKATGDILVFIDGDMQIESKVIEEINRLITSPLDIVAIKLVSIGKSYWEKVVALDRTFCRSELSILAARAYPKELFQKVQGYDPRLYAGEDWALTINCQKLGAKLQLTRSRVVHFENIPSFKDHLIKQIYYLKNIETFANRYPVDYRHKYASLKYRGWIYIKHIDQFLRVPHLSLGLFIYKISVYLISKIGFIKKRNDPK